MLDVVSGPDDRNPISLPHEGREFLQATKNSTVKDLRIAWSDNLNVTPVDSEILLAARPAIDIFRALGGEVVEDTPDFTDARETAFVLRGLRYVSLYKDRLNDPEFKRLVNPLVIGNIEQGLKLSIHDVANAERQRSELWNRVNGFFEHYDLLVTPTVAIPPFPADTLYPTEINGKPMENYIEWILLTYAITLTGLPAISLPCGWTQKGLPVGIQIVGRRLSEWMLLQAASAYELAAPWKDKRPPLR
jgi:amidase